jgi:chromosome segregation ATPase
VKLADVVNAYERARGCPLSLEEKLRLSVAENDARKERPMAHEDLYEQIEKRRVEVLEELASARATREELNANIKKLQDALDALPVPKTRRSPKKPAEASAKAGV